VAAHLNKQHALVIVPDQMLKQLPFSALVSPDSKRYLIEEYSVLVCPSASILARLLEAGKAKKRLSDSLLVLSNPKFSYRQSSELRPLPGTKEEITRVRSFYSISRQLSGEQATKQALLKALGDFEIAHLATHSFINEENPLRSSIVLAGSDNPEQNDLQSYEIFGLSLPRTRLVILSSCRSAANAPARHNSLGGLAQAFFCAGVPAVIGSLWEVDDASTAKLMTAFHHAYRNGQLSSSQALRQAQLTLLRSDNQRWQHPFYWAAFLLAGDGFNV
jgi:CHAT domain-containing protein